MRNVLALILILGLSSFLFAQDVDLSDAYPATRRARVAALFKAGSQHEEWFGGDRIYFTFEDDFMPMNFTLWVDRKRYNMVDVGDLFIFYYQPDGKLIKIVGPVKK